MTSTTDAAPVRPAMTGSGRTLLPFFVGLAIVMGIFLAATLFWGIPKGVIYGWDFRAMYTGGYLERTHPAELFNLKAQQDFAIRHISNEPVPIPFIHPAYEALLFAPFSVLPYAGAYIAFIFFNGLLTAACVFAAMQLFSVTIPVIQPRPGLMLFFFFPLYVTILQGQDSILFLLLLLLALNEVEGGSDWTAGLILGLALFKIQIVLPLVMLMAIRRGMRLAGGFLVGAVGVVLLSFVATPSAADFLHVLRGSSEAFGTLPLAMSNLRGVVFAILRGHLSDRGQFLVTAIASAVLLGIVAWFMRRIRSESLAYSVAVLSSLLTSYHSYPHDLIALAIPILIIVRELERWKNGLVFLLYLSPWVFFWTGDHTLYLTAFSIAAALGVTLIEAEKRPRLLANEL